MCCQATMVRTHSTTALKNTTLTPIAGPCYLRPTCHTDDAALAAWLSQWRLKARSHLPRPRYWGKLGQVRVSSLERKLGQVMSATSIWWQSGLVLTGDYPVMIAEVGRWQHMPRMTLSHLETECCCESLALWRCINELNLIYVWCESYLFNLFIYLWVMP